MMVTLSQKELDYLNLVDEYPFVPDIVLLNWMKKCEKVYIPLDLTVKERSDGFEWVVTFNFGFEIRESKKNGLRHRQHLD